MSDSRLEIVLAAKDLTGKVFAGVTTRAKQLGRQFMSMQGAILGLAGVGGFGLLIQQSFALNDKLAKTADKLGLTTEALSGLRHAAELTGVASNTLDMALQRMTRRVAEAAGGTGEAKNAIAELGLDARRLAALSPDRQFAAIAEQMARVSSQSDRVRLAFKLFDSEGVAVVNTLRLGSAGLRAAAEEADALGLSISRVEAKRIEEANDAMTRLRGAAQGMGNTLAIALADPIADIAANTTDWVKANQEFIQQDIEGAIAKMGDGIKNLVATYKAIPSEISDAAGAGIMGRILFGSWGPAKWVSAIALMKSSMDGLADSIKERFPEMYAERTAELERMWRGLTNPDAQQRAESLKGQIADIEGRLYRNPFHFKGDEERLAQLKRELAAVNEEIRRTNSEAAFRGREMAEYGGVRVMPGAATGGGNKGAGSDVMLGTMGLDQATRDEIDQGLDEYIGLYASFLADKKKLDADYLLARDTARGAYYVDPELARWEGGQGQDTYAKGLIEDFGETTDMMKSMARDASWSMSGAFADFFDSTSQGFLELQGLVKNVAASIARSMADTAAQGLTSLLFKSVTSAFSSAAGGAVASAQGNVFSFGRLVPFANGGILTGPTIWPMAGGGIGLAGEKGWEAIMPLTRTPGGKLGVESVGGGGQVVQNHYYYISALDAQSFEDRFRGSVTKITTEELNDNNGALWGAMSRRR